MQHATALQDPKIKNPAAAVQSYSTVAMYVGPTLL